MKAKLWPVQMNDWTFSLFPIIALLDDGDGICLIFGWLFWIWMVE